MIYVSSGSFDGATTTTTATTSPSPFPAAATVAGRARSIFIETEPTPNPESLKFVPGRPVLTEIDGSSEGGEPGSGFYATRTDSSEIARSPLAKLLFSVEGVKSVYLGPNFVTVTKEVESHWSHIRTLVFSAIMDHYASGKPALTSVAEVTDTTIFDDDDEVVAMIKELLESRIRPAVQEDGGDIRYVGFEPETGVVTVRLAGSCVGCPSSSVTLKNGVENMLMHYIPEVTNVVALEEDDENSAGGDGDGVVVEKTEGMGEDDKKMKSYEERLKAAGIPFSD